MESVLKFSELGLAEPVVRAVQAAGYETPTPIQAQAIPLVISGGDLLGVAQTGTGKTAAFALPILHRLLQSVPWTPSSGRPDGHVGNVAHGRPRSQDRRKIRVLVLSPTRELAVQIGESFATYGHGTGLRHVVVFGGVSQFHQVKALRAGVDILVATPGRLIDLREQGFIDLSKIEVLVLDEADRMLDMGFLPSVRRIVADVPTERQTLFFSATMPNEVRELADSMLRNPQRVEITPVATTAERVQQSVCFVEKPHKVRLLRHLLRQEGVTRSLIFTKTKHGADKVVRMLEDSNFAAEAIHANRSQAARQRALANFKSGRTSVLVATDIAARGIDVDGISHVFNYDLPMEIDNYVHRIGRTARAGASGVAISFVSSDERGRLTAIERLIRQRLDVREDLPTFPTEAPRQSSQAGHFEQRRTPRRDNSQSETVTSNAVVKPRRILNENAPPPNRAARRPHQLSGRSTNVDSDFAGPPNRATRRRRRFGKSW
jgi:ATP-dependent RNA helicase RhlE